jgi:hypothetical protein
MQVGMAKAVTLVKAVETTILSLPAATAIPQSTDGTIPNKMAIIREDQVGIDITPLLRNFISAIDLTFFDSIAGLLGRLLGGGHRHHHQRRSSRERRFGGGGDGYMGGGYPGQQPVYVEQQQASRRPGMGMGLAG